MFNIVREANSQNAHYYVTGPQQKNDEPLGLLGVNEPEVGEPNGGPEALT